MNDDLISRQVAIDAVCKFYCENSNKNCDVSDKCGLRCVICQVPSEQLKTGHWIERVDERGDVYYECSNCEEAFTFIEGTPADNLYNHCPKCGAKMEGERE